MKITLLATTAAACALALFAGCKPAGKSEKKAVDEVRVVPAAERSPHFAAVNAQLELGGTLYGYADIDGDILKAVPFLKMMADSIAEEQPMAAPFLKQDFAQLLGDLGLNDIKAFGLSSARSEQGGFRNRVYLHTPDGRRGLLAGLAGGEPAAFEQARLAPADADVYAESDIDVPAIYASVRALVARVAGEPLAALMEAQLQQDQAGIGVTPYAVIQSLKGRVTLVLQTDDTRTMVIPGTQPVVLPEARLLIKIDGLGATLGPVLEQLPFFEVTQEGAAKFFAWRQPLPVEGIRPVIGVEGAALHLATSPDFLREALTRTDGLAQSAGFKAALAELGDKGNAISYVSPRLFTQLKRIGGLNPGMPPESRRVLDLWFANLPAPKQPLVAVRVNLPDGILYRARWHRSLKQDVAMIGVYNPVTVGVMAAMAIPAFQKVRVASQEKTIINNLRQLSAAADQHMLENGVAEARYAQLVGPDNYVREITPVAGEDYTGLVIRASDREISVTTAAGKVVRLAR